MSHIHRPDGRLRLAATLLVGIAAALTQSLISLYAMLIIAILAMIFVMITGKASSGDFGTRLLSVNAFVVVVWITVAIDWSEFAMNEPGMLLAAQMTLRINIVTLSASMLLMRMTGVDLGRAAVGLGLPTALGALLAQVARQIALLSETKARLERAMRARAYRSELGLRSLQVSAQMVVWLVVHALAKAERISLGMRSRNLSATRWSVREATEWRSLPRHDWLMLGAVVIIVGLCVLLPKLGTHG